MNFVHIKENELLKISENGVSELEDTDGNSGECIYGKKDIVLMFILQNGVFVLLI